MRVHEHGLPSRDAPADDGWSYVRFVKQIVIKTKCYVGFLEINRLEPNYYRTRK